MKVELAVLQISSSHSRPTAHVPPADTAQTLTMLIVRPGPGIRAGPKGNGRQNPRSSRGDRGAVDLRRKGSEIRAGKTRIPGRAGSRRDRTQPRPSREHGAFTT